MNNLTLSIKHVPLDRDVPCGVCRAMFVPAEDSGSRVLTIKAADSQTDAFAAVLCGGCHSKWSHGVTVTCRTNITL
jgi:hypothetical protein